MSEQVGTCSVSNSAGRTLQHALTAAKQLFVNGCLWPGPGLPGERHKLTLVDRPTAPKVGFPVPSRTHTAGQERPTDVRTRAAV